MARVHLSIQRVEFKLITEELIGKDLEESGNGVLGLLYGNTYG
jgi:hypothetical protein